MEVPKMKGKIKPPNKSKRNIMPGMRAPKKSTRNSRMLMDKVDSCIGQMVYGCLKRAPNVMLR